MKTTDPITLELIRCRLVAAAQQMSALLWKSSYSTVIREILDYSTAMFDARGQMVAQSAQLPFQMMTLSAPLQKLVQNDYDWQNGDVILLNDPYECRAQHLPDFMVFRPIFSESHLVAFAGCVAHMIDTGGGAPGSYLATATEIFQEGLRIPPVKIVAQNRENNELLRLISLNVREPEKVLGDLSAMVACTHVGDQVIQELLARYGQEQVENSMAAILDKSENQFRNRFAEVPPGTYKAVDFVDDDGISDDPVRLELALTFKNGQVEADFSGSSPQVQGPVNVTVEMTTATLIYVLMAVFGKDVAKNDGCRRAVKILAPPGCALNARSPAPVASRVTTCHRLVDVILQALAQVLPDQIMAGYYGVSNICNLGGIDPQTGKPWVHFEIEVGGWGARPHADGLDGFSAHIHNVANTPIEVVESTVPLLVERYELIGSSGGKGQFRGGLGLRRDLRILENNVSLNLLGDHCKFAPKGLFGGQEGATGKYVLNPGTPNERVMPNKISNYRVNEGTVISMRTPGGGGYGPPEKRDPHLIEQDRIEGKTDD
jgi:N-methylhydantoinase B